MSLIRICDLPEMRYDETKDNDILVIENEVDTYKIPLGDFKTLFGSDSKLQTIYDELKNSIQGIVDLINIYNTKIENDFNDLANAIVQLRESVNRNTQSITEIQSSISNITRHLGNIDISISDLDDRLNSAQDAVNNNHDEIVNIKNTLNIHSADITTLKNKTTSINASVTQIQKDIANINKTIESMGAISSETLDNAKQELMKEIVDRYEEIMAIIDANFHQTPLLV